MILETAQGANIVARVRDPWRAYTSLDADTFTGRSVTPESALAIAAVYGAVSLIANAAGTMPLEVIDTKATAGRRTVTGGNLAPMLRYQPNEDMSGVTFWTLVFNHLLLRGNHYSINLPGKTGAIELWPVMPQYVTPFRDDSGKKMFRIQIWQGGTFADLVLSPYHVLHIMGPSFDDGLTGASPIGVMRNRIGVQLAQSEYQGRFYQDGMSLKGVLTTQQDLTPEAAERIKQQWRAAHQGLDRSHDIAVVHSGATFAPVSLSPDDAQFIETMKFGASEIATAYNLPASRLNGEGASLTYANQGQDDLFVHKQAVFPRLRMVEDCLNMDPMLFGFQSTWVPRFNTDANLRADVKTRFETYQIARNIGVLSANDIRRKEGDDPIAGGDDYTPLSDRSATPEPAA